MGKMLEVPPELQHLVEKREATERRKTKAGGAKPRAERRRSQRRKAAPKRSG